MFRKRFLINKDKIGKSTINDILRNENKFAKYGEEKEELGVSFAGKFTKRMHTGNFDKVSSALHMRFRQQRERRCPINGPILQAAEFQGNGEKSKKFIARQGFQWTFCKRFEIKKILPCPKTTES